MLADFGDFYGDSYWDALKHTAKLAGGMTLGSAVYILGAIPGHALLSSYSPRAASVTYALGMGAASVWAAKKWAKQSDLVMAGAASALGMSAYTLLFSMLDTELPVTATAAALPASSAAVHGLDALSAENKEVIRALTRLPIPA